MKRFAQSLLLALFVCFTATWTCAQNGPTFPSVVLTFTNVAQPTGVTATGNCIYRGSASGNYVLPALFCSTLPISTYSDNTPAASTTYWYAVTTKAGTTESQYSTPVQVVIGAAPVPPTGLTAPTVTAKNQTSQGDMNLTAEVRWEKRK